MDVNSVIRYLKCPMCEEPFKHPKRLPCGHNVCRKCLQWHINRTVIVSGHNIMDYENGTPEVKPTKESCCCPVDECKKEIQPMCLSKDVNQWAYLLQSNLELVTIIEICCGKTRSLSEYCDNCIKILSKQTAMSVCFTCLRKYCTKCEFVHRITRQKHVMYSLSSIRNCLTERSLHDGKDTENLSGHETEMKSNIAAKNHCKVHIFNDIDSFCVDCKESCCTHCRRKCHSHCKTVENLKQLELEFHENGKRPELAKSMKEMSEQIASFMKSNLEILDKVQSKKQEPCEKVARLLDNVKNRVILWETLYEHIQTLRMKLEVSAQHLKPDECIHFQQEYQIVEKHFLYYRKNKEDPEEVMKNICGALEESELLLVKQKQESIKSDEGSESKEDLKTWELGFLSIEITKVDEVTDFSDNVSMVGTFDMRCPDDKLACWLTDCTFVDRDFLIAVDNSNQCLKWKEWNTATCKLELTSGPWCLAVDQSKLGCVTLPIAQGIQFFKIVSTKFIQLKDNIKTNGQCFGVAFLDQYLITSNKDHGKAAVKILSREGKEIMIVSNSNAIFQNPKYLAAKTVGNSHLVYVTDFNLCNVTCITLTGFEQSFTSEIFIKYPLGVAIDSDGNVLICTNSSGTVHQIVQTENMKHSSLVKALKLPRAIACLKGSNKFAVSVDTGPLKSELLVFEIQSRVC